jgi:hypothetical protein
MRLVGGGFLAAYCSESAGLEIANRFFDFFAAVHHEGTVADDGLFDRFAAK